MSTWSSGWLVMLGLALQFAMVEGAAAQTTVTPPAAPPTAPSPPVNSAPPETADCPSMPTVAQREECLREHPLTGNKLLPDEKNGTVPPLPPPPKNNKQD